MTLPIVTDSQVPIPDVPVVAPGSTLRAATPEPVPPVRVLHVINGEHFAGAERVQDLLALGLPQHGFEVGFAALKAGRFGDARRSVETPMAEAPMATRWDIRTVGFVCRMAQEGGYQLLHAHTPRSLLIASLAARRTGLPLVYHVHSPTSRDTTHRFRNWVNSRIEGFSLRSVRKLITVSPTLSEHMQSFGVTGDRLRCVPNGVPSTGGTPRTLPEGGWATKSLTVGMVALFRPRKGAEVLLEAVAALRARGHQIQLRMIGPFETEDYEQELVALARRLDVGDAVRWTGFTDGVAQELERIDVLALPSLFGEGLPMVVLEAMAAALPVVATHSEGLAHAVQEGETGLLVEPGKAGDLAQALEDLYRGQADYEGFSRAALERHAAEFSDDIMAGRVAEVYRGVLQESRRRI